MGFWGNTGERHRGSIIDSCPALKRIVDTFAIFILNSPIHSKERLVTELKKEVNIDVLDVYLKMFQIRTRYYFSDQEGSPFFTITFDETFANSEMKFEPFFEIEFEINEVQMGKANKAQGDSLIKKIGALINEARSTNIELLSVNKSKYERGMERLGVVSRAINDDFISLVGIVLILVFGVVMVIIRKKNAQKQKNHHWATENISEFISSGKLHCFCSRRIFLVLSFSVGHPVKFGNFS